MKLLDAKVNWRFDWANSPELMILVDEIPDYKNIPHRKVVRREGNRFESTIYWGEQDGLVDFFVSTSDKNGYGGRTFDTLLEDGTREAVKGPWSSGCYAMNVNGFPLSADCLITTDLKAWDQGYAYIGGHITLEVANEACELISKRENKKIEMLNVVFTLSDSHYYPVWTDNPCDHSESTANGRCSVCQHKIIIPSGDQPDLWVEASEFERYVIEREKELAND